MYARISEKTEAIGEALSLADAKAHLRVDYDAEDALISAYIAVSIQTVEQYCGITLLQKTLTARFDGFANPLILRRGPVVSVSEVRYVDSIGVSKTVPQAAYSVSIDRARARLAPASGVAWPATISGMDVVEVDYQVGYVSGAIPMSILHAMKLLVGHYYENRTPVNIGNITTVLPFTISALLGPYKDMALG